MKKNDNQKIAEVSMKKLFLTVLTVLTSGAAFALPVGNPSDASLLCDGICWEGHCGDMCDPCLTWCDAFSVRFGFYGDYVWERHLEVDRSDFTADVDHSAFFTNAAYFAGNFYDRFDIFCTLGATKFYLEGNRQVWAGGAAGITGLTSSLESESYFSWSVGARGTIWECGCTTIGAEAQYFQTKPHITRTVDNGNILNPPHDISGKWYEWQFAIGISYRINFLVPYAAVKWASGKMDFGDAVGIFNTPTLNLWDLKTNKTWGYAVGVSLVDCEKMSLSVEGRFADETALSLNGQIRF